MENDLRWMSITAFSNILADKAFIGSKDAKVRYMSRSVTAINILSCIPGINLIAGIAGMIFFSIHTPQLLKGTAFYKFHMLRNLAGMLLGPVLIIPTIAATALIKKGIQEHPRSAIYGFQDNISECDKSLSQIKDINENRQQQLERLSPEEKKNIMNRKDMKKHLEEIADIKSTMCLWRAVNESMIEIARR